MFEINEEKCSGQVLLLCFVTESMQNCIRNYKLLNIGKGKFWVKFSWDAIHLFSCSLWLSFEYGIWNMRFSNLFGQSKTKTPLIKCSEHCKRKIFQAVESSWIKVWEMNSNKLLKQTDTSSPVSSFRFMQCSLYCYSVHFYAIESAWQ